MKKLILLAFAATSILVACKKKSEDVVKTTAEKVQGLWKVTSIVSNEYYSNANHPNTQGGIPSDYLDFRADGKVYSQIGNPNSPYARDTSSFSIVNDNTIKVDGLDATIKTLNDNQFILYSKDTYSQTPLAYDESTITLYR
jgi:hypothetical protein